jgi:hypothetical protein
MQERAAMIRELERTRERPELDDRAIMTTRFSLQVPRKLELQALECRPNSDPKCHVDCYVIDGENGKLNGKVKRNGGSSN